MTRRGLVTTRGHLGSHITVSARVMPACYCGRPVSDHGCATTGCQAYAPSRPIEEIGTRAYHHWHWICRVLWAVEVRIQGWRERAERRVDGLEEMVHGETF